MARGLISNHQLLLWNGCMDYNLWNRLSKSIRYCIFIQTLFFISLTTRSIMISIVNEEIPFYWVLGKVRYYIIHPFQNNGKIKGNVVVFLCYMRNHVRILYMNLIIQSLFFHFRIKICLPFLPITHSPFWLFSFWLYETILSCAFCAHISQVPTSKQLNHLIDGFWLNIKTTYFSRFNA